MNDKYETSFYNWATSAFLNTSQVDRPTIGWFKTKTENAINWRLDKDKPVLIGLCGNAGTGKDSATEFIMKYMHAKKMALADPIREIGKIFGFTAKQMSDRKLKESEDPRWGISPRTFMQKVGTEMFRNCWRQDIWIQLLKNRVNDIYNDPSNKTSIIFVTDIRFPNEVEAIKSLGGHVIKIHRDGFSKTGQDLHPSEAYIQFINADLELTNDAASSDEWSWKFTKNLGIFLKKDAYYYN